MMVLSRCSEMIGLDDLNRVLADAELIEPEALLCNPSVSMICVRSCIGAPAHSHSIPEGRWSTVVYRRTTVLRKNSAGMGGMERWAKEAPSRAKHG